jgi:hypothetical protein
LIRQTSRFRFCRIIDIEQFADLVLLLIAANLSLPQTAYLKLFLRGYSHMGHTTQ